jgi:transcription termination/antitermination protein NusA
MNGKELLSGVEYLHREKNISRDVIFSSIEKAVRLAIHKCYDDEEGIVVNIDRATGEIHAQKGEQVLAPEKLGRIPAQAAKQTIIQILREEESQNVFDQYSAQKGDLVHGTVQRFEGGAATVTIAKVEALLPRGEQIPGESHHVGERVKAVILDVRKVGHRVKIILSRTHPDFVRRLFESEIPEIEDQTIAIKAVAREAGHRTKVAVSSIDMKVDCVGACVGVRGSRIKNIVDELGGEKIDIVRWNESSQILITNALKPAEIVETSLNFELNRATVVVNDDQLSLAIGKRGQNVRLAARLTGWDVDILTPNEYNKGLEDMEKSLKAVEGVTEQMLDRMVALGIINLLDIEEVGTEPLVKELEMPQELAEKVLSVAVEDAKRIAQEDAARKAAEDEAKRNTVSPLDAAMAAPVGAAAAAPSPLDAALAASTPVPEPAPVAEPVAATQESAPTTNA